MLFVDGRGRAFNLTLFAVVLATMSCAGSLPQRAPVGTPSFLPMSAPAAEARPEVDLPTELKAEAPRIKDTPRATEAPRTKGSPRTKESSRAKEPARASEPQRAKPASRPAVTKPLRAPRVDSLALELAVTRQFAHGPLAMALARRTRNPEMADLAASAVVREAERLRLSPSLLAAVLLIENAPLDSVAVSREGAIGMMQIMPVHLGSFGCGPDLVNVDSNICHGARLLKHLVRRTGSMPVALRQYNGCVRGRNTPRCQRYPERVLRTASRLRHEVLLNAAESSISVREALASGSHTRAVTVPSQPVSVADSMETDVEGGSTATCTTFVGCLRYRWSSY